MYYFYYYVYVMCVTMCIGQRTTLWSWFFLFTFIFMWILGLNSGCQFAQQMLYSLSHLDGIQYCFSLCFVKTKKHNVRLEPLFLGLNLHISHKVSKCLINIKFHKKVYSKLKKSIMPLMQQIKDNYFRNQHSSGECKYFSNANQIFTSNTRMKLSNNLQTCAKIFTSRELCEGRICKYSLHHCLAYTRNNRSFSAVF